MSFDVLSRPLEQLDASLTSLFAGAPFVVALLIAFLLGLRHASDPDHLVAVTALVAADRQDTRSAARLGAWWGLGHAAALVLIGLPLIALASTLPSWVEAAAERAIGLLILLLAARVVVKWLRGDFRAPLGALPARGRRHGHAHRLQDVRTPRRAAAIGVLHGLAGSGAIVLLLIAALPSKLEAAAALLLFAPTSMASMAGCTAGFAWVLTRPRLEPAVRVAGIPFLGVFGVLFGGWYAGIL